MNDDITVGELVRMLRSVDGRCKIKIIVLDDECKEIKMEGYMDYIIKPKDRKEDVVFYAGGQATIGEAS